MKDSVERIREDGCSKSLLDLTKRWKRVKWGRELVKNQFDHAYVTLYNHDGLCCYHEGIVEKSSDVVMQVSLNRVVEVNVESHHLLSVNYESANGVENNQVLNLSDEGDRWEGDVLHDEPYGWGVLYDKEGEMAYEGFRIGDVSVCYGTQYYADIQKVEYEGEICEGKRWGRGIQYDRNGVVVFDGEWMNDGQIIEKRVEIVSSCLFIYNHIEELIVNDGCNNGRDWVEFDFSILCNLKHLQIGDDCFGNVNEVKLIGLHALKRVVIGQNSFTKNKNHYGYDPSRHFYLKDCEQLKELKMGRYSFSDFSVCEITNVPSLEVIKMGKLDKMSYNFYYASLELKSDGDEIK